jgi:hypothetical protein
MSSKTPYFNYLRYRISEYCFGHGPGRNWQSGFDTLAVALGTTGNPALDISIINAFAAIRDERCAEIG